MFSSVPVAYYTTLKETYVNPSVMILNKIGYAIHQWCISPDLKRVAMVTGLQSGNKYFSCCSSLCVSRARHHLYVRKEWPERQVLTPARHNVRNIPLAPNKKIILPPVHIKLSDFKHFVKAVCEAQRQQSSP